jgi:hypothetical protein
MSPFRFVNTGWFLVSVLVDGGVAVAFEGRCGAVERTIFEVGYRRVVAGRTMRPALLFEKFFDAIYGVSQILA